MFEKYIENTKSLVTCDLIGKDKNYNKNKIKKRNSSISFQLIV